MTATPPASGDLLEGAVGWALTLASAPNCLRCALLRQHSRGHAIFRQETQLPPRNPVVTTRPTGPRRQVRHGPHPTDPPPRNTRRISRRRMLQLTSASAAVGLLAGGKWATSLGDDGGEARGHELRRIDPVLAVLAAADRYPLIALGEIHLCHDPDATFEARVDAVLWLGPETTLTASQADPAIYQCGDYSTELQRRSEVLSQIGGYPGGDPDFIAEGLALATAGPGLHEGRDALGRLYEGRGG